MSAGNPIHKSIFENIMKPEFEKRKLSVQGRIMEVDGEYAAIYWREPGSGTEMESENVPLPIIGDGLFSEGVNPGDFVMLEFRNGNYQYPFVSAVHGADGMDIKTTPINSDVAENGTDIPDSLGTE